MEKKLVLQGSGADFFKWSTAEEFATWLQADPANLEQWSQVVKSLAQGRGGNWPPEVLAQANELAASHHAARCLKTLQAKLKEVELIMLPAPGSMPMADRLSQLRVVVDEITDILLETPEPHRTKYLKRILPVREWLRNYPAN